MKLIAVTELPYAVNKETFMAQLGTIVNGNKMTLIENAEDTSQDDGVRVEIILKKGADEAKVLAYLYKHTSLQVNVSFNLTCLVPTENPEVGAPARLGLKEILWHFLHFRLGVVTRTASRTNSPYWTSGFTSSRDSRSSLTRSTRSSRSSARPTARPMRRRRFKSGSNSSTPSRPTRSSNSSCTGWRSSRSTSSSKSWTRNALGRVRSGNSWIVMTPTWAQGAGRSSGRNLLEILEEHGKSEGAKRRTVIDVPAEEVEYSEEDFIVAEDTNLLVTKDGWVKRQREIKEPMKSRIRDGDRVLACVAGSTRATVGFFSSAGTCYTARFIDLPASKGYGEPIQKIFKLKDGEEIVGVFSFDSRATGGDIGEDPNDPEACPMVHGFAATTDGYALRFALDKFIEPSTRSGRKYARPAAGQAVVGMEPIHGSETILAVTERCRAIVCPANEINYLSGPGKGVRLIKVAKDDKLIGFKAEPRRSGRAHRRNESRRQEEHLHGQVPHDGARRPRQ